jgi:hypothetical protein
VELDQLESSVAVRRLHECKVHADALEPDDAVHPAAIDRSLAPQLESELDEELSSGTEVVDHDADVVHPLDRHVLDGKEPRFEQRRHAPGKTRRHLREVTRSAFVERTTTCT